MQGDMGNAYLESYTQEKVYFIAGAEFGHHAGTTYIIEKALYGLCSSGLRFHERLSNVLQGFDFTQSHVDLDMWIHDAGNSWEYIVVYVDDIIVAMKDPKSFFDELQDPEKVSFKMKGVGSPTYHLGADFFHDDDGTLCLGSQTYAKHLCSNFEWLYGEPPKSVFSPLEHDEMKGVGSPTYHLGADFFHDNDGTLCLGSQTYAKRLCSNFEWLYGEPPKSVFSPLEHDDHPELDNSPFCGPEDTSKFQSLIGACQWMISLCCMDIAQAIMFLSRFRHCPRQGHVDRLKRVCGNICKFPQGTIRFRVGILDHESIFGAQLTKYEWMETVYGTPVKDTPSNALMAKGNPVRTTMYADANLLHDLAMGRSAPGMLHFLNQTPIDSFSKRQNQVESATYSSEFMAAWQAVEQIIDLRYTLRMLGVPIEGPSWLFGDNKAIVTSSTIPHSSLNKRWNAISYHKV